MMSIRSFPFRSPWAVLGPIVVSAVAVWLAGCAPEGDAPQEADVRSLNAPAFDRAPAGLRYDREFPAIEYSRRSPGDQVARLLERLRGGETTLARDATRGYLDAVLNELGIDPASQVLVFSKTSQQIEGISASTPRAIYFNDETYVAWVPGAASLELAALDANLGPVFYTLPQTGEPAPERRFELCLSCHDSYSLTGGGVPRFITGSGYIGRDGNIAAHEGWILTSDRTPLRSRWGGWYVSGFHGEQVHLGNIIIDSIYDLEDLASLRDGNREDLRGLLDVSPYLTDKSDIVALLVLEHQVTVQNAIVRLNWDTRQSLETTGSPGEVDVEPLVRALLLAGTPAFTDPIRGTAGFADGFVERGLQDADGRSLRDLDLRSRLFRYPLSYVIHSGAFAAMPRDAVRIVLRRVRGELTGEDARIEDLPGTAADRMAAWEILSATAPGLVALVAEP
jgi:hypothetical protein